MPNKFKTNSYRRQVMMMEKLFSPYDYQVVKQIFELAKNKESLENVNEPYQDAKNNVYDMFFKLGKNIEKMNDILNPNRNNINLDEEINDLNIENVPQEIDLAPKLEPIEITENQIEELTALEEDTKKLISAIQDRVSEYHLEDKDYDKKDYRNYEYMGEVSKFCNDIELNMQIASASIMEDDQLRNANTVIENYKNYKVGTAIPAINEYEKYIESGEFDSLDLPENIRNKFSNGYLTEDVIQNVEGISLELELNRELGKVNSQLGSIDGIKNEAINNIEAKEEKLIQDKIDKFQRDEIELEQKINDENNATLRKLVISNEALKETRPTDKIKEFNDNVSLYNSEKFKNVSDSYKNGGLESKEVSSDWLNNYETPEELSERKTAISNKKVEVSNRLVEKFEELDRKTNELNNLKKENITLNNDKNKSYDKDTTYNQLFNEYSRLGSEKERLDNLTKEITVSGISKIDNNVKKEFGLSDFKENAAEKGQKIKANLKVVYNKYGKGPFRSTPEADNYITLTKELNKLVNEDLPDAGFLMIAAKEGSIPFKLKPQYDAKEVFNSGVFKEWEKLEHLLANANKKPGKFESKEDVLLIDFFNNHGLELVDFIDKVDLLNTGSPFDKAFERLATAYSILENFRTEPNVSKAINEIVELDKPSKEETQYIENAIKVINDKSSELASQIDAKQEELTNYSRNREEIVKESDKKVKDTETEIENIQKEIHKAQLDSEFLDLSENLVNEQIERRTLYDKLAVEQLNNDNIKKELANLRTPLDEMKRNHEVELKEFKEKVHNFATEAKENVNKKAEEKTNELTKKQQGITKFKEVTGKLFSASRGLKNGMEEVSDAQNIFRDAKNAELNKLNNQRARIKKSFENREDTLIQRIIDSENKKWYKSNTTEFNNMLRDAKEYKLARENYANGQISKLEFDTASLSLQNSLNTYISGRDRTDGTRKWSEVGQIRIDSAKRLFSTINEKEKELAGYDKDIKAVQDMEPKKPLISTKAEQVVFNSAEKKMDAFVSLNEEAVKNTLVGNKGENAINYVQGIKNLVQNAPQTIKNLVDKGLTELSNGDKNGLKKALSGVLITSMIEKGKFSNPNELQNQKVVDSLGAAYMNVKAFDANIPGILSMTKSENDIKGLFNDGKLMESVEKELKNLENKAKEMKEGSKEKNQELDKAKSEISAFNFSMN